MPKLYAYLVHEAGQGEALGKENDLFENLRSRGKSICLRAFIAMHSLSLQALLCLAQSVQTNFNTDVQYCCPYKQTLALLAVHSIARSRAYPQPEANDEITKCSRHQNCHQWPAKNGRQSHSAGFCWSDVRCDIRSEMRSEMRRAVILSYDVSRPTSL